MCPGDELVIDSDNFTKTISCEVKLVLFDKSKCAGYCFMVLVFLTYVDAYLVFHRKLFNLAFL